MQTHFSTVRPEGSFHQVQACSTLLVNLEHECFMPSIVSFVLAREKIKRP